MINFSLNTMKINYLIPAQPLLSKLKTYEFIIAIIVGIGGLAVGGAGVAGYFHAGALSSMAQIDAIIMMAAGSGGGVILLIVGIIGTVKNRKAVHESRSTFEPQSCSDSLSCSKRKSAEDDNKMSQNNKKKVITQPCNAQGIPCFGPQEWGEYIGDVGEVPLLPEHIEKILKSPCPFSGDKSITVQDTHMLLLIPKTLKGEDLIFSKLYEIIQSLKQKHPNLSLGLSCSILENFFHNNLCLLNSGDDCKTPEDKKSKKEEPLCGSAKVNRSYWVLMTRGILFDSKNKPFNDQQNLMQKYDNQQYVVPDAIETAVFILMQFVTLGIYPYDCNHITSYILCPQSVENNKYCMNVRGCDVDVSMVRDCRQSSNHNYAIGRLLRLDSKIHYNQDEFIRKTKRGFIRDDQCFGKAMWQSYFGDVGDEPPLPEGIEEILNNPCPFSGHSSVKVRHTHMLVLIPKTVNGQDLTFEALYKLKRNLFKSGQGYVNEVPGDAKVKQSHWVLMTRNVLPGSVNRNYYEQEKLVQDFPGYSIPNALTAAICILAEFEASGICLFDDRYIRCLKTVEDQKPDEKLKAFEICLVDDKWRLQTFKDQEPHIVIGKFTLEDGLKVCIRRFNSYDFGVAAVLRL